MPDCAEYGTWVTCTLKIVIVSNEIVGPTNNGGIGSFCTHLAQLLSRETDHEIVIVYTYQGQHEPRSKWIGLYDQDNIHVIEVPRIKSDKTNLIGGYWFLELSRRVNRYIPGDADVVIFQENNANGFYSLRKYRFQDGRRPVTATVLHSSADWIRGAMQQLPARFEHLIGNFGERYGVQHSDYVLSLSQYMVDWVRDYGWKLPPDDFVRTVKGPFLPRQTDAPARVHHAERFKRLIYFGRLETRKGLAVFVDGLVTLQQQTPDAMAAIDEIVFVGREANHRFATMDQIKAALAPINASVIHHGDLDTYTAQQYLADHAADSLVVLPSLIDNHPYALMEVSLIPGLNFIASNVGGIPEIVGEAGQHQLFAPNPPTLADALRRWLEHGPLPDAQLGRYDYETANRNWVNIAEEMCQLAQERSRAQGITRNPRRVTIDVCTVWNDPAISLEPLLQSMKAQTVQEFNFYIYNNTPPSNDHFHYPAEAFKHLRREYKHHDNWHFINGQTPLPRAEALNKVANLGSSEVIIFIDAANMAVTDMVARFVLGLLDADEDCLTANAIMFDEPEESASVGNVRLLRDLGEVYLPLGNAPEVAPFWNPFGLVSDFIVYRDVFKQLGGFPTMGDDDPDIATADGDYSFFVNLVLSGYSMDVIPDYLTLHRLYNERRHPFKVSFPAQGRVHLTFAQHLENSHLQRMTTMGWGMGAKLVEQGRWFNNALGQDVIVHEQVINSTWLAQNVPIRSMLPGMVLKALNKLRPSKKAESNA